MDGRPPGSSVRGILKARILEWVAIYHSKIREALQNDTLKISSQLRRRPLISLFHLYNLLQMPTTVEWLALSSSAACHVAVRGSALMTALSWSLSTSDGWPLHSSSSKLSSLLQNLLNHHCTVRPLAVPGPNAVLMLWVVSTALWLILNSKSLIFCLTSFP